MCIRDRKINGGASSDEEGEQPGLPEIPQLPTTSQSSNYILDLRWCVEGQKNVSDTTFST